MYFLFGTICVKSDDFDKDTYNQIGTTRYEKTLCDNTEKNNENFLCSKSGKNRGKEKQST